MAIFTVMSGTQALFGTSGNDTFNLPDLGFFGSPPIGFSIFSGSISGGAGVDTLRLLESSNSNAAFADGPTTIHYFGTSFSLSSVERLQFASTAGNVLATIQPYGAFGSGNFANIELIGGAGRDHFALQTFSPGSYVMPNFNLTNWQGNSGIFNRGDSVFLLAEDSGNHILTARDGLAGTQYLRGGSGHDILNGANGVDRLVVTIGGDSAFGNGGNDFIEMQVPGDPTNSTQTGGQFSGGVLDGGAGTDTLVIGGRISYSGGTITGIEKVLLLPDQPYVLDPIFGVISGRLAASLTIDSASLGTAPKFVVDGTGEITVNVSAAAIGSGGQFDGSRISIASTTQVEVNLVGTDGNDIISGTNGRDTIFGGSGNDVLRGFGGANTLIGEAGDDQLFGGASADRLAGGIGADRLRGGGGADAFFLLDVLDSTVALAGRDTISDFRHNQGDQIDLSELALSTAVTLNLGGSVFTSQAGELIQTVSGLTVTLQGDINGDGLADFALTVMSQGVPLVIGDFVL